MGNENYIVKKRCTWLTVLKVILVIAAVSFVAYKIYEKFAKKKNHAELEAEDADLLCDAEETDNAKELSASEEPVFEVAAEDVIANPESMEA